MTDAHAAILVNIERNWFWESGRTVPEMRIVHRVW
jgi:hypothetical protein